jgi:hypothetical protein
MGYLVTWGEEGQGVIERDTVWCRHCQRVLEKKSWLEQGARCSACGLAPVCHPCFQEMERIGYCRPWKKLIDQEWDRLHRRSMI